MTDIRHPETGLGVSPWSRTFPATLDQVGEARRFLAGILSHDTRADDAILCLSELAANAIQHSRSARPGGTFHVRFRRSSAAIRIEVTDLGGPWGGRPESPEHGRGLEVVRALASRGDVMLEGPPRDPHRRTVWFEIQPR